MIDLSRQAPPKSRWNSAAGKLAGNVALSSTVGSIKAALAIALGLVIAGSVWFFELLATKS